MLLVLYATGALISEVLALLEDSVNLKNAEIAIRSNRFGRSRTIPIGPDLQDVLRIFLRSNPPGKPKFGYLFSKKDGRPIRARTLASNFRELRQIAGITRSDGATYQPRMHDLRSTFAVHRITSWIRNSADLNRMLPALSIYMGQLGLASTERYLSLTPERFRKDLDKLSPRRGRNHWRDDPSLMKFLAEL